MPGDTTDPPQNVLEPAGRMAEISDRAWQILFPAATIVFVVVTVALIWLMVRYRTGDRKTSRSRSPSGGAGPRPGSWRRSCCGGS
jgi:heme/copper-type cytochrome/quinol oxidase subunit 2